MREILSKVKKTTTSLAKLSNSKKSEILEEMAFQIDLARYDILKQNKKDLEYATKMNYSKAMIERLSLDEAKIDAIMASLEETAKLADPVGRILSTWERNGLEFKKVSIPIGVICVVYESRPNVTSEVAGLCFKSGNACVLKGGKEAINSNKAIVKALHTALEKFNIDKNCITFLDIDREAVGELVKMDKYIDVVIPRGGAALIKSICENSTIPVIKHDKGLCHIFIDASANIETAVKICVNAKIQKPSACNAVETLLVHEKVAKAFLPTLKNEYAKYGVEIYGCNKTANIIKCANVGLTSYQTEYLDLALNIKVVKNVKEAIEHIQRYSSSHSEAIISKDNKSIEEFVNSLDSACLYINASTRFSDGFEFGFGAEVGISTNKLHARGPMGLDELTTYKYIVRGNGQIRK